MIHIDDSYKSDSMVEWNYDGFSSEKLPKMKEGRSLFAAVAVDGSFSFCKGILVTGGYTSTNGLQDVARTTECFDRGSGESYINDSY